MVLSQGSVVRPVPEDCRILRSPYTTCSSTAIIIFFAHHPKFSARLDGFMFWVIEAWGQTYILPCTIMAIESAHAVPTEMSSAKLSSFEVQESEHHIIYLFHVLHGAPTGTLA